MKKFRKLGLPLHLVLPLLPSPQFRCRRAVGIHTFRPPQRRRARMGRGTPKPTEAEPHRRWMPWPPAFKSRRAGHDSQGPSPRTQRKYGPIIHSPPSSFIFFLTQHCSLSPHSNGGLTAAAAPRHPKGKASFANKPTDPRLFSSAPAPAARGAVPALRTTNPTPSRGAACLCTTEAVAAASPRRFRRSATRWL